MSRRYMNLESKLCKELELLEEKYSSGAELSESDLRRIDLLAHAMKSIATFVAMRAGDYDDNYNRSYSMDNGYGHEMMGRYADRNMMSRNMNHDMSGYRPYYPEERRW